MDEISGELHCEATHGLGIGLADLYQNGRIYGPTPSTCRLWLSYSLGGGEMIACIVVLLCGGAVLAC
jgi:hypothetical protein